MSMFPDEAKKILEKLKPKERKAVGEMIDGALLAGIDFDRDKNSPSDYKKWRDLTKWAKGKKCAKHGLGGA